jgi:16S rRNA processing protein RimM
MNKQDCYSIGYISKTHGLKGEVTAVFTEPIELDSVESVFIEMKGSLVPYFIQSFSDRGDKAFLKFEDVNTAEQAANLKGSALYLNKTVRPSLKRGEFYNDEVVGFVVEDETEGKLGLLKQVIQSGPSRLLEIDYNGKDVLIPVNGPFIKSVNKSKKLIKVTLPEGFLSI